MKESRRSKGTSDIIGAWGVFMKEAVTLLRSTRTFLAAFLFLAALCAVVYIAWPGSSMSATEWEEASRGVFRAAWVGALIALALVAPVFAAGSFAGEREKRTLELLLSSPVSPRAIWMGKLMAPVAVLWLFIALSAPVFLVWIGLPGVSLGELAFSAGFLACGAATFAVVGLAAGIRLSSTRALMLAIPLSLIAAAYIWGLWAGSEGVPGGFTLLRLGFAMIFLLAPFLFPGGFLARSFEEKPQRDRSPLTTNKPPPAGPRPALVLPEKLLFRGANVVVARELASPGKTRFVVPLGLLVTALGALLPFVGGERAYGLMLVGMIAFVATILSAGSIAIEREKGTLDLLMTSLISPAGLVWGKFAAAFRACAMMIGVGAVPLLFGVLSNENFTPGEFVAMIALLFSYAAFYCALAVFLSASLGTTVRAMIAALLLILALWVGQPVYLQVAGVQHGFGLLFVTPYWAFTNADYFPGGPALPVGGWPFLAASVIAPAALAALFLWGAAYAVRRLTNARSS